MTERSAVQRPVRGHRRPGPLALWTVVVAWALTGCSSAGEDEVHEVVAAFYSALADGQGEVACELLAPATLEELEQGSGSPCGQAILEEGLRQPSQPQDVALFDSAAQVSSGSETAFLSKFQDGWKVVAAGCTPKPPDPYDCLLTKG